METIIQSSSVDQADSLLDRYIKVRKQSTDLCQGLQAEDFVVQPIEFVSPPKWHLGHITWFFENFILAPHIEGYQLFDERLNWFFNSYYESQGPRILRSQRGNMTRPSLERVMEYRKYVDNHMQEFLSGETKLDGELRDFITIGLHHEQQHQELLAMDIKYILGNNPLYPVFSEKALPTGTVRPLGYLDMEEGLYKIGHQGEGFSWDNEHGVHRVFLDSFSIQDRLVTNGEYLEFMEAGGYEQFEHWLSEGWEWAKQLDIKAPLYWYPERESWQIYTLAGMKSLDPNFPVSHISYYEADAYARWKGMRLPSEFEWEVAAKKYAGNIPETGNFLESGYLHPYVAEKPTDYQFLGHAWEWTGSAYLPYPDYPRLKGALGEYNGKFMVNQMVLRGGSCATPISHIRSTYRNFFHANMRWQFTGLRLVKL